MAAEGVGLFLRHAEDFSRGMGLLREDIGYVQSAALLAIHSAIAYSDALRVARSVGSLSSDDHQTALKALYACVHHSDLSGVDRLRKLLAAKSAVAYGDRRLSPQRLQFLCIEAERFALWANKIAIETRIEGWRSEMTDQQQLARGKNVMLSLVEKVFQYHAFTWMLDGRAAS